MGKTMKKALKKKVDRVFWRKEKDKRFDEDQIIDKEKAFVKIEKIKTSTKVRKLINALIKERDYFWDKAISYKIYYLSYKNDFEVLDEADENTARLCQRLMRRLQENNISYTDILGDKPIMMPIDYPKM